MCRTRVSRLLLLLMSVCLCAVLMSEMTNAEGSEIYHDVHQKMQYHLSELLKDFPQLHTRAVYKRSATMQNYDKVFYEALSKFCNEFNFGEFSWVTYNTSTTSPNYDKKIHRSLISFCSRLHGNPYGVSEVSVTSHYAVIYKSLRSFCSQLNPSANKGRSNRRPNVAKSYRSLLNWTGPDIFPPIVFAYKSGDYVKAQFKIVRTGPAFVFRSESFQFRKIPIDYPPLALGAVWSTVVVEMNATKCKNRVPVPDVPTNYAFYLKKKSTYRVSLSIDLCTSDFDNPWEKGIQTSSGSTQWRFNNLLISPQDIAEPLFKINSGNGPDEIVLKKYENVSVDVEVEMLKGNEMFINVYMWQRGLKGLIYDSIGFRLGENNTIETLKSMPSNETDSHRKELLYMTILRDGVKPLVRTTVHTASMKRTGQLELRYHRQEAPPNVLVPFIRSMEITRTITLRRRHAENWLPRNTVLIHKELPFECDHRGNKNSPKQGRNCTIRCRAFGRNIKSILIEKVKAAGAGRAVNPVQKVSYIVGNEAFAMIDMGPVSKYIGGKYKCCVQMTNGFWEKQDIMLHTDTTHIPGITQVSIDIYTDRNTGKQYANFSCRVDGSNPLDVSLHVHMEADYKWVMYNCYWYRKQSGETVSCYKIPTHYLMYPAKYFNCSVSDQTHNDNALIWFYTQNFTYYPEPAIIDRNPNASYVSISDNGTLKAVCSVISRYGVIVTITLPTLFFEAGKLRGEADINNIPGAHRDFKVTMTRRILTVFIPANPLKEEHRDLNCVAIRWFDQVDIMTLSRG